MDPVGIVPELASPEDVPALAGTFADAFANDPMIRWPMPDASPEMLQELFRVILTPYTELGVLWKLQDCRAGAAWLPPDVMEQFGELEQATRAAIKPLTPDHGLRYAAFWDWLDTQMPDAPCWFLDVIAVAPEVQGNGLGRTLLRHGIEQAHAHGCFAFLETGVAENVPFYESHGFRLVRKQPGPPTVGP